MGMERFCNPKMKKRIVKLKTLRLIFKTRRWRKTRCSRRKVFKVIKFHLLYKMIKLKMTSKIRK